MVNTPLVSIVTPSFNKSRFIAKTIESVVAQDYAKIEHIVIDGNSTDGTQEILARYSKLIWVSEPDRGQSHALNKGFRLAEGEILGWLNADDTYQPRAIETAIHILENNPSIDAVYSDLQVIDEEGKPIRLAKAEPFDRYVLPQKNVVKQPTIFMRRSVYESTGEINENLHYVMDWEYWLRAGLKSKFLYLQDVVLANFRLCSGTKSFDMPPEFHLEWLNVLEEIDHNPDYGGIPRRSIVAARRMTSGAYYLSRAAECSRNRDRVGALVYLMKSFGKDARLSVRPGNWLYALGRLA